VYRRYLDPKLTPDPNRIKDRNPIPPTSIAKATTA
jgi:hypothetical protein